MKIIITYTSIDGFRSRRVFSGLKGARNFAKERVGAQDVEGGWYAVSSDGVGKIVWEGVTRAELFGEPAHGATQLNKVTTFYSRGNELFCRQAGYTFDHEGQLFGRIIEAMDNVTGDYPDGFRLRGVDQRGLFCEDQRFATREAALASAKEAMLAYLECLYSDAA